METEIQSNKQLQAEEIEALAAIFGDEFKLYTDNFFSIKIFNSSQHEFYLQVTFPESYPLFSIPNYQISAPWMKRQLKIELCQELENISGQQLGECIVFLWIDFIKNFIDQHFHLKNSEEFVVDEQDEFRPERVCIKKDADNNPDIIHGKAITDRKSVFQAHLAQVKSVNEVKSILEKMRENKKIAAAEHNVYAYRIISGENKKLIHDFDNDREAKAGPVLLHLLEILNLTNILIVVTRWYGGIHLGSDRFKHYNEAARSLISDLGYITNEERNSPACKSRK